MDVVVIGSFETREEADEACTLLDEAGIVPSVADTGEGVTVSVPADVAYFAVQVLADADDRTSEAVSTPQCPECASYETRKTSPYALYAAVIVIAAAVGLAWLGMDGIAIIVVIVGWLVVLWLSRLSGKYRCKRCGWQFSKRSS